MRQVFYGTVSSNKKAAHLELLKLLFLVNKKPFVVQINFFIFFIRYNTN